MFSSPNNLTQLVREFRFIAATEDERMKVFDHIVKLVETRLLWFLSSMCPEEAHDLAQQSLVTAYRRIHELRDERRFWPWLARIASNLALDYFRRRDRKPIFNCDPAELEAYASRAPLGQEDSSERKARIEAVFRAIKSLDEEEQRIIQLYYFAELPWETVGQIVGKRRDAVRMQGHRILARLRTQLEEGEICGPQKI